MKRYTLIIVPEGTGRVQRLGVSERGLKWLAGLGAVGALLFLLGFAHYLSLRGHMAEFRGVRAEAERVRAEAEAQRAELQSQAEERQRVADELTRVKEFERRVRVIANLPQTSLERIAQRPPPSLGVGGGAERPEDATPPMGTPTAASDGEGGTDPAPPNTPPDVSAAPAAGPLSDTSSRPRAEEVAGSEMLLERLVAESQSLEELVGALRGKSERLAATPSAWPAEGWVTSGFGYRISPFTGRRDFHEGVDIAAEFGTPIVAPAPGRVVFAGRRGGLGTAIVVDHGFGVRTTYGHLQRILVQPGTHVARGQQLATMGSSGLSTGPHVHYMVEVGGKRVDPLDYIVE
ncbi:MAG TPA: peptidoglycan DD-metalloendopeptidase family protein [Myxococcota bacterium]|nr:peptidoglycan DD-metalloendopeptidase family protein [Myxococcota bacterium]